MAASRHEVIELVGTSNASWEKAARAAVDRAVQDAPRPARRRGRRARRATRGAVRGESPGRSRASMRNVLLIGMLAVLAAASAAGAAGPQVKTDEDNALYALGLVPWPQRLTQFRLHENELDLVK